MIFRRILFATITLVFVFRCAAPTVSAQDAVPIPCGPDAITERKSTERFLKYQMKVLDEYKAKTKDPMEARASAAEFLDKMIRTTWNFPGAVRFKQFQLYPLAKKAIADGSTDPIVLSFAARTYHVKTEEKEIIELADRAEQNLEKTDYSERVRAEVWMSSNSARHAVEYQPDRRPKKYPELRKTAEAVADWLAAEGNAPDDQLYIWFNVRFYINGPVPTTGRADAILQLIRKDDQVSEAVLNAMEAHFPTFYYADDYADGIDEKERIRAMKVAREAGKNWQAICESNPNFFEPAAHLINLSRDKLVEKTPRYWFDKAVKAQLDYMPAYKNYRKALLPEHGGSLSELYKFGVECANTKRYDTKVPFELLECLRTIDYIADDEEIWQKPGVYERVKTLLESTLKEPIVEGVPISAAHKNWYNASHIAIAYRAKQYEVVDRLWNKTAPFELRRAFSVYRVFEEPEKVREIARRKVKEAGAKDADAKNK